LGVVWIGRGRLRAAEGRRARRVMAVRALIGGDCAEFGVQDAGRVFAAGVARRRAALRGAWLGAV
jgi:hypothetical protein